MVGPGRLELPTPRLSSVCSNQLSYGPDLYELDIRDARPYRPEAVASRLASLFQPEDWPEASARLRARHRRKDISY